MKVYTEGKFQLSIFNFQIIYAFLTIAIGVCCDD